MPLHSTTIPPLMGEKVPAQNFGADVPPPLSLIDCCPRGELKVHTSTQDNDRKFAPADFSEYKHMTKIIRHEKALSVLKSA